MKLKNELINEFEVERSCVNRVDCKVIPSKWRECLKFSKTWSTWLLCLEHFKNAIRNRGHHACFFTKWIAVNSKYTTRKVLLTNPSNQK